MPADVVIARRPHPTIHPPVARDASHLWMAPSASRSNDGRAANPALVHLQAALRLYADEKYELALARFSAAGHSDVAAARARRLLRRRVRAALRRFDAARRPVCALKDTAGFRGRGGGARRGRGRAGHWATSAMPQRSTQTPAREQGRRRAGHLAEPGECRAGRRRSQRAAEAFLHLYYEFPLSEHAAQAEGPLQTLSRKCSAIAAGNVRYKLELGRGERLFGSRRYPEARDSFLRLKPHATGTTTPSSSRSGSPRSTTSRERYSNAREALRPYLNNGARQAEARFFYLMSQRGLRNYDSFELLVRALAKDFPDSTWAEEALNNLATFYIQQDSDDEADAVLREMYARFPRGRYAERAAWKAGWTAYRAGNMSEAARYFESAATNFPRSDYRPAWLYWSGRARDAMGDRRRRHRALSADDRRLSEHVLRAAGRRRSLEEARASARPSTLVFARQRGGAGRRRGPLPADRRRDSHAARAGSCTSRP